MLRAIETAQTQNPPPVVVPAENETTPLDRFPIEHLVFQFRKAMTAANALPPQTDNAELDAAMDAVNLLRDAIVQRKETRAGAVALQLATVVEYLDFIKSGELEEALSLPDLRHMASDLLEATRLKAPPKRIGLLARAKRLTRAGLLFRYQSFLVQELETVSWHLHGDRDYGKFVIMFDEAVREKCRPVAGRKIWPFFDESRLSDRARAVLRSLKIDTKSVSDRAGGKSQ